ncbi:MAG: response regulator transcription factor [Clostridia bacterium]|nr:response regulator transcription factor [Clostridia bacterium]
MLKIYICEDDKKQLDMITKAVEKAILTEELDMKVEVSSSDPFEILHIVEQSNGPGIYFLDVELNAKIDGIELASNIRNYDPRGFIVFVTTHPELSYLTFKYKVEALDYIIKSENEDLNENIRKCILNANKKFISTKKDTKKFFYAKCGQKVLHIPFEEIIYFETSLTPHKVLIHTLKRRIEFYGHIGEIVRELDDRFYKCHKSYIINKDHISMVDKKTREIFLNGDNVCTASVRAIKGLYDQ